MLTEICLHLQKHEKLKTSGDNDINVYLHKWISCKLKTDRYRNSKKNIRISNRRKEIRNDDTNVSNENDTSFSDSSSVEKSGKRKRKRIVIESSSENESVPHDTASRPFADLITLLAPLKYPQINPTDNGDYSYSWEYILKEIKWTDNQLCQVMTPNSYVIIEGKPD